MLKNVKYWAGLFDADGSFDFRPTKRNNGNYYLNISATLYQKDISVLEEFSLLYGIEVKPSKGCSYVRLHGSKAEMFMNEVKKHLVVKRKVVEYLLTLKGTTVDALPPVRNKVRQKRKENFSAVFPSRQWMAGYIDGDGCILSSYRKSDGVLEFKLSVVSHVTQMCGLALMKKQFGGSITEQGDVRKWTVSLSISKGKQVLGYFMKHLKMKLPQAALVMECLNSRKHLRREGATHESNLELHRRLQSLKSTATTK
jgi:intein/homing endonuclease